MPLHGEYCYYFHDFHVVAVEVVVVVIVVVVVVVAVVAVAVAGGGGGAVVVVVVVVLIVVVVVGGKRAGGTVCKITNCWGSSTSGFTSLGWRLHRPDGQSPHPELIFPAPSR